MLVSRRAIHLIAVVFSSLPLYSYILAKHPPSAGFPLPSGGAEPRAPPLGCLRRPFGKPLPSVAVKKKKNGAPKNIGAAAIKKNIGAPAAPQMVLKT